jgi:hypothetical protein
MVIWFPSRLPFAFVGDVIHIRNWPRMLLMAGYSSEERYITWYIISTLVENARWNSMGSDLFHIFIPHHLTFFGLGLLSPSSLPIPFICPCCAAVRFYLASVRRNVPCYGDRSVKASVTEISLFSEPYDTHTHTHTHTQWQIFVVIIGCLIWWFNIYHYALKS